jgi:hypothetical protein
MKKTCCQKCNDTKTYCDRCNDEIHITIHKITKTDHEKETKENEICQDCAIDFEMWMQEIKMKGEKNG